MPGQAERRIQYNDRQWTLCIPPYFVSMMGLEDHEKVVIELVTGSDGPYLVVKRRNA